MLIGIAAPVLAYIGLILLLERFAPEHLPPPAIANRIDLDDKLRLLRESGDVAPVVLALGSSSAGRSIDGTPFQGEEQQSLRFFNASVGGAQINQLRFLSGFYLNNLPEVRAVVTMLVPADFVSCSVPDALFDRRDAAAYAFARKPSLRFYLEYFNLFEFLPQLRTIATERSNWGAIGDERRLYTDRFGSRPMEIPAAKARARLALYEVEPLDPKCFDEVRAWSRELRAAGVAFFVVLPPISPLWLRATPGAVDFVERFRGDLRAALQGEGAEIIDGERVCECGPDDFLDAYHLQWSAAQGFSRRLAAKIQPQVALAPRSEPAPDTVP